MKIINWFKSLFHRKKKLTEKEAEMEEFLCNIASLPNVTIIRYTERKKRK